MAARSERLIKTGLSLARTNAIGTSSRNGNDCPRHRSIVDHFVGCTDVACLGTFLFMHIGRDGWANWSARPARYFFVAAAAAAASSLRFFDASNFWRIMAASLSNVRHQTISEARGGVLRASSLFLLLAQVRRRRRLRLGVLLGPFTGALAILQQRPGHWNGATMPAPVRRAAAPYHVALVAPRHRPSRPRPATTSCNAQKLRDCRHTSSPRARATRRSTLCAMKAQAAALGTRPARAYLGGTRHQGVHLRA